MILSEEDLPAEIDKFVVYKMLLRITLKNRSESINIQQITELFLSAKGGEFIANR